MPNFIIISALSVVAFAALAYLPVSNWYANSTGREQGSFYVLSFLLFSTFTIGYVLLPESPTSTASAFLANLTPVPALILAYRRSRRLAKISEVKAFQSILRAKKRKVITPVVISRPDTEQEIEALIRQNRRDS